MTSKYKNSDVDQRENAKDKPKVPLREKIKVLHLTWKEKNPMLRLLTFKEQKGYGGRDHIHMIFMIVYCCN